MTVSAVITNTGNTRDDSITVEWGTIYGGKFRPSATEVLPRGTYSAKRSFSKEPTYLRITGKHGQGEYLGEVAVEVSEATADRAAPAEDVRKHMGYGSFAWAIGMVKMGRKVQRAGWNGKGMYIYLKPASRVYEPCIAMHTAQGTEQPGWLASQADLLAEDWQEVE